MSHSDHYWLSFKNIQTDNGLQKLDMHMCIQCTKTHTGAISMTSGIPYRIPRLPPSLTCDTNESLTQKQSVSSPTPLESVLDCQPNDASVRPSLN